MRRLLVEAEWLNYYNDNDPYCVERLRSLIDRGRIPGGDVDERSIRDVEPATVPHFHDGGVSDGYERAKVWLKDRGFRMITTGFHSTQTPQELMDCEYENNPDTLFIMDGMSPRGVDHSVICRNGKVVHDPAGEVGGGLVGPTKNGTYGITYIVNRMGSPAFWPVSDL